MCIFFFQAEDGIRDLVRSRGLGDVYKRQESLAELGRTAEALVPLETVRARARAQSADPANTLLAITTTNQLELIDLIRHERLVELGFEMHRFFDLVRWGIAADVIDDFVSGKNEVFPIPQTELDLNPNLQQNPNYN